MKKMMLFAVAGLVISQAALSQPNTTEGVVQIDESFVGYGQPMPQQHQFQKKPRQLLTQRVRRS